MSKELEIASSDKNRPKREDMSRARVTMRDAKKYMIAEDWYQARDMYEDAASLSTVSRDYRTAAIARLEQARCELMLGHTDVAEEVYKSILANPDASPAVASMAHYEYLVALITQSNHQEAHRVYEMYQGATIAPFSDFTSCLVARISRDDVKQRITGFTAPVKNDALLTMAVRSWLDGDVKAAKSYFKDCTKASIPNSEWPAPYAKYLYGKLL